MKIKKDYPALHSKIDGKQIIYFDNACAMLKPKLVIDAINYYYHNLGSCAGSRGTYSLNEETNDICERSRELVANFINASPREIIWTKNTTESINLVANSFRFNKDDEVIVSTLDHHSNILPFYEQRKRGVRLKILEIKDEFDLEQLKKTITPRTKIISLTHASNVTGQVLPMKDICDIAHEKDILVLSDEAQFIAHKELDLRNIDADFAAFSSHKIGGDTGLGVLYVKEELLEQLENYNVGGSTVTDVLYEKDKFIPKYIRGVRRFEAGLQHYSGIIGIGAAVKQLTRIGLENIETHEKKLIRTLWKGLSCFDFRFLSRKSPSNIPVFSFVPKINPNDFAVYMDKEVKNYKIMMRAGNHCASPLYYSKGIYPSQGEGSVRISLFAYNTKEELDIFIEKTNELIDKLNKL